MSNNDKILVPTYRMETEDYYFLLKLVMGLSNKKNVNGIKESFFNEISEKSQKRSLKRLSQNNIISMKDSQIMISEAVKKQLNIVLNSSYSLCFNNNELKKNNTILMFYFANGYFSAVMSDDKKTTIARSDTIGGIMHPFEKTMLKAGLSNSFDYEKWGKIARDKFAEPITKPNRSCVLALGSNRDTREVYSVTMVADKHNLQILRGKESDSVQDSTCETISAKDYYGVIYREIEHLKEQSDIHSKNQEKEEGKRRQTKEKTDYERIVESKGFPKSGVGFIFYTLFNGIKSLPMMIKALFKKKLLSFIAFIVWSVFVFLYNIYATCFVNDTFMFNRKAVWGNLTPYLMAGQITTPNEIYGFDLNFGTINTVFLAAPLALTITYLLHHIITHIKKRKLSFFPEVIMALPGIISKQVLGDLNKKKIWIIYAVVFALSFVITNPITILLLGILFLMMSAQGRDNALVQFVMTASCAFGRKKVDAGKMEQPTIKTASENIGVFGEAFLIYSIVNLLLWKLCHYNFYMRLITTMILVFFCILQIVITDKKKIQVSAAIFFVGFMFLTILSQSAIVLADDGGITESGGTIIGLMHNAGFSLILGISIATIGFMIGGAALIPVAIFGGLVGGGVFITGLTDTEAGKYVRKSSNQFYDGPEEGDKMTLLCAGAIALDLVTSLFPPKLGGSGLKNGGMLAYKGMSLAKDVISTAGDVESLIDDSINLSKGEGSVFNIAMDVVGLGFDVYGLNGDIGDLADAKHIVDIKGSHTEFIPETEISKSFNNLEATKNQAIADANATYSNQASAEQLRHQQKVDSINNDINQVLTDTSLTDAEKVTRKNIYTESLRAETDIHSNNMQDFSNAQNAAIDDAIETYYKEAAGKIADDASKINDMYQNIDTVKGLKEDFADPNINDFKKLIESSKDTN